MLVKFQNQLVINNLEMTAQDRYLSITGCLYKLSKHHEYKNLDDPRWTNFKKEYVLTEQQIHDYSELMLNSLQGWQSLLEHKAWQQLGSTDMAPSKMCELIVSACLIELSQNINSDTNLSIFREFLKTEHNLRKGIGDIGYQLSQQLVEKIKANCIVSDKDGLSDFLNLYSATIEQVEEHREMEDMCG